MAAVLSVMRQLHEMLLHLDEVDRRAPDARARAAYDRIVTLTAAGPEELLAVDVDALRGEVGDRLREASVRVRRGARRGPDLGGRDLAGLDLRGDNLRGADLRGAQLIRADLRGCDLTDADLLGADVRDADVRGADLSGALFLSQGQANGLRGDAATAVPDRLSRPGHWG
jgi:hypothetical protein